MKNNEIAVSDSKEKNLDFELLLFYLTVALFTLSLYLIRHPLLSIVRDDRINASALLSAYLFDLIIFLAVLVPYVLIIIFLVISKIINKVKISDNIMLMLFFPLFSFFAKGMSLLNIYVFHSFIEILKDNFAFFCFLFAGPAIVFFHKALVYLKKKVKQKK